MSADAGLGRPRCNNCGHRASEHCTADDADLLDSWPCRLCQCDDYDDVLDLLRSIAERSES